MKLPTERRPPLSDEPSFLIVYGPPKVGKTSSISQLPDTLILDTEQPGGTRFVECMSVPIMSFATFMEACREISAAGKPYKFVVIDSIDALERMCVIEANVRYGGSNIAEKGKVIRNILTDLAKGAGYPWLWDAVRDALDAVSKCAPNIILVGHLKEKLLPDGMTMEDSEGADLDLTGKVRNIVCSRADAIGLLKRKPRPKVPGQPQIYDLWINFRTTDMTNCGNRIARLAGREFLFSKIEDKRAMWEEIFPSFNTPKV